MDGGSLLGLHPFMVEISLESWVVASCETLSASVRAAALGGCALMLPPSRAGLLFFLFGHLTLLALHFFFLSLSEALLS